MFGYRLHAKLTNIYQMYNCLVYNIISTLIQFQVETCIFMSNALSKGFSFFHRVSADNVFVGSAYSSLKPF